MADELSRIVLIKRSGNETLHSDGHSLGYSLLDFWRWSASDLVSNAQRGVLAEFLVATALGIDLESVRDEWSAYDLITHNGIKIEVKSAAFIQSWKQTRFTPISFRTPKTKGWSADTNIQEKESRRQAQVYVFALLSHRDKPTLDPLNVSQWAFYVLPTLVLDARTRSQHSITLPSLEKLSGKGITYYDLREAVYKAAI